MTWHLFKQQRRKQMTKEEAAMVRDLMVTLEYLRAACELSYGKRKMDNIFLTQGMSAGIGTLQRYKHLIPDYERKTYWDDVWEVGARLDTVATGRQAKDLKLAVLSEARR